MLRKWPAEPIDKSRGNRASMRPEHGCSGNDGGGDYDIPVIKLASMRPEHGCSGNGEEGRKRIVGIVRASMRPEHGCSGNVGVPCPILPEGPELQ